MRILNEPASTLYRSFHKPRRNQKIVKASDIKLNDVLINGVKLRCFQAIKNNPLNLARKNPFSTNHKDQEKPEIIEFIHENTLFKNNAIKKRLRSLQNESTSIVRTNEDSSVPKKPSIRIRQGCRVPIQILHRSSRERKEQVIAHQNSSFRFIDINKRYYSQLNKELQMYSTNNHFYSSNVKNRIKYGKYIGLQMKRQKQINVNRQSNLIKEKTSLNSKDQLSNRYQSQNPNRENFYTSLDEKAQTGEIQQVINEERQCASLRGSNQKLKICYSTKHQFKRWKSMSNENNTLQTARSRNSDVHPEEKLISTMTLE